VSVLRLRSKSGCLEKIMTTEGRRRKFLATPLNLIYPLLLQKYIPGRDERGELVSSQDEAKNPERLTEVSLARDSISGLAWTLNPWVTLR
jgi:hypothetical protein